MKPDSSPSLRNHVADRQRINQTLLTTASWLAPGRERDHSPALPQLFRYKMISTLCIVTPGVQETPSVATIVVHTNDKSTRTKTILRSVPTLVRHAKTISSLFAIPIPGKGNISIPHSFQNFATSHYRPCLSTATP